MWDNTPLEPSRGIQTGMPGGWFFLSCQKWRTQTCGVRHILAGWLMCSLHHCLKGLSQRADTHTVAEVPPSARQIHGRTLFHEGYCKTHCRLSMDPWKALQLAASNREASGGNSLKAFLLSQAERKKILAEDLQYFAGSWPLQYPSIKVMIVRSKCKAAALCAHNSIVYKCRSWESWILKTFSFQPSQITVPFHSDFFFSRHFYL